ncbi:ankyrin repeat domain-containing protein [Rhodopirellula sp. JC740]|uniref:Ankyrin repeat domain-containing protein n=1 Tax=Rhodopirellula halodulae TaxID=2894198 RepID=A0ABS8NI64_9BACT|nr:ankyrin repeat domain-containing protein [Rhodopirellula sp. JC740]MCC9643244.1 ankyrin repeat domain-containing protein [Rhodopirellula sp. JC740]
MRLNQRHLPGMGWGVVVMLAMAFPVMVVRADQTTSTANLASDASAGWLKDAELNDWSGVAAAMKRNSFDANQSQPDGMTAVLWAAYHDQPQWIERLHAAGADLDVSTQYLVSPLSLASEFGNMESAQMLVRLGANVNSKRLGKETPLMLAARQGNAEIVQSLIEAGVDLDEKETRGQTALMWAAAAGNSGAVDVLLKAGCDVDHALSASGLTAWMFAARHGRTDVIRRLLEHGVDVNSVVKVKRGGGRNPRDGMSALMFAVESGHLELAVDLVRRGADPNDQRSGYGPLHAISWVRKTERGDNPEGDPAPRITGGLHSLAFVRQMVELGADVNLRLKKGSSRGQRLNPRGGTPFFLAARGADIELMQLLLELGADPNLANDDDTTPLMAAAGVGVIAVGEEPGTPEEVDLALEMLVSLGNDPNAVDRNRETAMHGAALRNFPTAVRKLAELGAVSDSWNHKNKRGWTPFDIARGKRPGSVKPSPPTVEALKEASSF